MNTTSIPTPSHPVNESNDHSQEAGEIENTRQRFRVERVAFIAIVSVIGAFIGAGAEAGPLGVMLLTGFLLTGCYVTAQTFMGVGGFQEAVSNDDAIPSFDWTRLALEPLYLLGVALAVLLITGVFSLVKFAFAE